MENTSLSNLKGSLKSSLFPIIRDAFGYELQPQPKRYAPRWPRKGGVPDFCIRSIPVDVAKDNYLRFFGEVKSPKKIENARNDMTDYLQSDIDLHAIAILTDGFDWELWVRPRNQSLADLANPYAEASLKNPLMIVQRRNMEVDPYRSYEVRKMIDVDGLSAFCLDAIRDIIEHEFRLDPDQIFS